MCSCNIFSSFLLFFLVSFLHFFLPSFLPSFLRPFIVLIHGVRAPDYDKNSLYALLLYIFFGKPYLMGGTAQNNDISVFEAQKWTFSLAFIFSLFLSRNDRSIPIPCLFLLSRIHFLMNLDCSRNARDSWTNTYIALENFHLRRKREDTTGFWQVYCRSLFLSRVVSMTLEAGPFSPRIIQKSYSILEWAGLYAYTGCERVSASLRYPCNRLSNISFFFLFFEILFAEDARGRDGRETTMRRTAPYNIISRPSNPELYRLTSSLRASGYPERRSRRFWSW